MEKEEPTPDTEVEPQTLSTEDDGDGTATRPSDLLDKGAESTETIPRKSSLL